MTLPAAAAAPSPDDEAERVDMFDLAPVSLWLEDYSALRALFDTWRAAGVTDIRAHLAADPSRAGGCAALIRVVRVNRRTLQLFGALDREHLVANLHLVFRDAMHERYVDELVQLWNGETRFTSQTVNYTLQGARLDIALSGQVLPGHESTWRLVLVSIEDVSERTAAQRALGHSEAYARALFEHSPVSLWVEDYRAVKTMLDAVRASGVTDLSAHMRAHPEFTGQCARAIRVLDVNRRTLSMFGAPDRETLFDNLERVFRDELLSEFPAHLLDLWNGRIFQQREVVNHALDGGPIDLYLQFAMLPGHEHDWGLALVSLIDITARKRAEGDLAYLGTHDSLTGLRNRSFFAAELLRLEREGPWPVAVMMFDLNGLKPVNDQHGHAAGDQLIRRAGDVLGAALAASLGTLVGPGALAARLGGDEFALLLPATDPAATARVLQSIVAQVEIDNTLNDGVPLSFSSGVATLARGESAHEALHLADERMYADKREHYVRRGIDRRSERPDPPALRRG